MAMPPLSQPVRMLWAFCRAGKHRHCRVGWVWCECPCHVGERAHA